MNFIKFYSVKEGALGFEFDSKLFKYFINGYLVKDDQIIIADCVFSNLEKFSLFREFQLPYDNWFMFQRFLN